MDEAHLPVEIPLESISADALEAIIESFILREGTDYGNQELSHETKVDRIKKQLSKSEIKLIFDSESESVTFMSKKDWEKLGRKS